MEKFLETYKVLRLTQEEIQSLNRPITSKEIESVIILKISQRRKAQDQMNSLVNLSKYLKNH